MLTPQTLFVPSYKAFRLVVLAKKILKVSINQKQELPMAAICNSSWHSSFREEVGVIKIRKLKDRQHNSQKNDFFFIGRSETRITIMLRTCFITDQIKQKNF